MGRAFDHSGFGLRLRRVVEGVAVAGGVLLVSLALLTCLSIIGRWINMGPFSAIQGDYELVEIGTALVVFAFLPYCQMERGHVSVDLFTRRLPERAQDVFRVLEDSAVTLVAALLLWRLYLGFGEKFPYFDQAIRDAFAMGFKPFFPETTYEWQIPVWIPFGIAALLLGLFLAVAVYGLWRSVRHLGR